LEQLYKWKDKVNSQLSAINRHGGRSSNEGNALQITQN
jgi:hypothetical protein